MTGTLVLDPLLPWPPIWGLALLGFAAAGLALWRGLPGWWLRGLGAAVLVAALLNPALQQEERAPLDDIVILVVDETASQSLSDRAAQTAAAVRHVEAAVAALPGTELRRVTVPDAEGEGGSRVATALAQALAEEPSGRVGGVVVVTDGRLHDVEAMPAVPAPVHVLLTGRAGDWDRRLVIETAPAFAILGEEVRLRLRIEDQGRAPPEAGTTAELDIAIDGAEPARFRVPVGETLELPVTLPHGGINVLQFAVAGVPGELTLRNNAAVVQINGVRDRLRVLLVSGEPHAGERTWRNLLKSDPSVDLVHFTILRPPDKQDGVPVSELSLIAFPTRELFVEKIEEFDLIIFDRYRRRGILPASYFENIRAYVEGGGAVLVAAGPDYAAADSIWRTALSAILPGAPTARVIEEGFRPEVSDLGRRHPVTEGLEGGAAAGDGGPAWGRWFRLIEVTPTAGQVVMEGAGGRPLLILDRVGAGRVALLASDHAWLWARGYEGGGPQLELLRRLAHWMMKEPDLEEEALMLSARGRIIDIQRRSLAEGPRSVTVTDPAGTETVLALSEDGPGRHVGRIEGGEMGLYRIRDGELERVIALGPAAPREFEQTVADAALLAPAVAATRGGVVRIEDGLPDLRRVAAGRPAAGRGWIGITPRGAYVTADLRIRPLLPAWAFLLVASALAIGAWLREGRR